jgi:hypothetical protein
MVVSTIGSAGILQSWQTETYKIPADLYNIKNSIMDHLYGIPGSMVPG